MKIYPIEFYVNALKKANLLVGCSILDNNEDIKSITYDSNNAKANALFACKGVHFKEEYLQEAISKKISCYVSEKPYKSVTNTSFIIVSDIRIAMQIIADIFYDKAYDKLNLIGITGTKGKSTTAYYIKYIIDEYMQECGEKPCGIISTIDTYDGYKLEESHLTTPEAFELHRHFDNAVQSGLTNLVMEVSSQALKYDRVLGVNFDIGIFINISEDHISPAEHSDFDDYFNSKLKLFSQTKTAIVNLSSDHIKTVLQAAKSSEKLITTGFCNNADFYCYGVKKIQNRTHFNVKHKDFDEEFVLTMPGLFNVENALLAIACAIQCQIPIEIIKRGLYKARSRGRMEVFSTDDNETVVIVDYAHNKLSFEKLYQSTLEEYPSYKIITVFGCPGNKAYNRRKELGNLAGQYSSKVYLTADDPAYEEVAKISLDISQNIQNENCECYMIDDRGDAIKAAILNSEKNTVILVAGKGHEASQKVGSQCIPYKSDSEYVKECLEIYSKEYSKKAKKS